MKRVSHTASETMKLFLHQKGRVTSLHLIAVPAVAFSYIAGQSGAGFPPVCIRSCGMAGIVSSIAAWWPVAISWLIVKDPGESPVSFRWWQVLFALVNIAAVVGYLGSVAQTLGWTHQYWSALVHCGLLVAIAPLAVEARLPPNVDGGGPSSNITQQRTRDG